MVRRNCALIAVFATVGFIACDSDTGSGPSESGPFIEVSLMEYDATADQTNTVDLSALEAETFAGRDAVPMQLLVGLDLIPKYDNRTPDSTADDVDRRPLYAYRLIGSDGFSAHESRDADDQRWEDLGEGYIMIETRNAAYNDDSVPGMYKVNDVAEVEVYRKVEVITPDTAFLVELADLTHTTFSDEPAVALENVLAGVASPQTYQYSVEGVDGYSKTLTWAEVQAAYWRLDSDKLDYSISLAGSYKIGNVYKIEATAP